MKRRLLALFLFLIAAAAVLAACAKDAPDVDSSTADAADDHEDIVISTPYCDLHYPLMWEDRFSYEIVEDALYTVRCFATVDEHDPVEYFDVVFGDSDTDPLGTLDGVPVAVVVKDVTFGEDWTEGEISAVNAMYDDIDYLVQRLYRLDGFVEM